MPSENSVTILGHLARDPELKYTPSGAAVTNFTVATSWGSGEKKETEWHQCVVWNNKYIPWAEQTSKMQKGDLVYLKGRLKTRSWEKDGEKRYRTEILADFVHFMRRGGRDNSSNNEIDDSTFPGLAEARRSLTDESNEPPF